MDAQQISQRASLLQRYLCDEEKELQALYALQALMVHMEQPASECSGCLMKCREKCRMCWKLNVLHMILDWIVIILQTELISSPPLHKFSGSRANLLHRDGSLNVREGSILTFVLCFCRPAADVLRRPVRRGHHQRGHLLQMGDQQRSGGADGERCGLEISHFLLHLAPRGRGGVRQGLRGRKYNLLPPVVETRDLQRVMDE